MTASRALAIGAAIVIALAAVILLQRSRPSFTPIDAQLGQTIFRQNCAVCHGPSGEGRPPAPPLNGTGHAHHHPDWELYMVIAEGKTGFGMPAWKETLSNREIRSVIAYMKTLWAEDQRRFQERVNQVRPTPP